MSSVTSLRAFTWGRRTWIRRMLFGCTLPMSAYSLVQLIDLRWIRELSKRLRSSTSAFMGWCSVASSVACSAEIARRSALSLATAARVSVCRPRSLTMRKIRPPSSATRTTAKAEEATSMGRSRRKGSLARLIWTCMLSRPPPDTRAVPRYTRWARRDGSLEAPFPVAIPVAACRIRTAAAFRVSGPIRLRCMRRSD
jgi:hypothetical protein